MGVDLGAVSGKLQEFSDSNRIKDSEDDDAMAGEEKKSKLISLSEKEDFKSWWKNHYSGEAAMMKKMK